MRIDRRQFVTGIAGLLLPIRFGKSAIVNGAVNTDRAVVTAAASINNFAQGTIILWLKCTTITNTRRYWAKSGLKSAFLPDALGNIRFSYSRSIQNGRADTTSTPLATPKWTYIVITYDSGLSGVQDVRLYLGTQTVAVAQESVYGNVLNGSGTISSDTGTGTDDLVIGNASQTQTFAFQGQIALHQYHNVVLSTAEMLAQQERPMVIGSTAAFHVINQLGTIPDQSGNGNTATVTGATLVPDIVPFPVPAMGR